MNEPLLPSTTCAWTIDDNGGAARFTLPLPLSPYPGALPPLSLDYAGQGGNGAFGIDWHLAAPLIARRTSHGVPRYDDNDIFLAPDGERLIADEVRDTDHYGQLPLGRSWRVQRYRRCVDVAMDRVEQWTSEGQAPFWLLHARDGNLMVFGKRVDTRLADPSDRSRIAEWRLQEIVTPLGEHICLDYRAEDGAGIADGRDTSAARYLARVRYGCAQGEAQLYAWGDDVALPANAAWHVHLLFDHGERALATEVSPTYVATSAWPVRSDPVSDYRYGFEHRQLRLCRQILLFHRFDAIGTEPVLVRRLLLAYEENTWLSRLVAAQHIAYGAQGAAELDTSIDIHWSDVDVITATDEPLPRHPAIGETQGRFVDLYGEGVPGALRQDNQVLSYAESIRLAGSDDGVTYLPTTPLAVQPATRNARPDQAAGHDVRCDLETNAVDGRAEWTLASAATNGRFVLGADRRWTPFSPIPTAPTERLHAATLRMDADGSGRLDLCQFGPLDVRLWRRDTQGGYAREVRAQHHDGRLPAGPAPDIWLDVVPVLGSGPAQLTRVARDGRVTCWPNLGGCRFGAGVALGAIDTGAALDATRLFAADIDGTGLADLLYATSRELLWFRNLSGQGFSPAVAIDWPTGMRFDRTCSLSFGDTGAHGGMSATITVPHGAGDGLAPRQWRMDFHIGAAHRVVGTTQNRGSAHVLDWRSSAQAWLDEKASAAVGVTPASHLHYAFPVLAHIAHHDDIAGTVGATDLHWRHGFHDAYEGRFRGFVRRDLVRAASDGVDGVHIRSWFHVGDPLLDIARDEFDDADALAVPVGAPVFTRWIDGSDTQPADFTGEELAVLWRSLAGTPRRTEQTTRREEEPAGTPGTVSECRQLARWVDPSTAEESACFVGTVETVTYTYEDSVGDPRCEREIVATYDAFGEAVLVVAIDAARRVTTSPYPPGEATAHWSDSHDDAQAMHHVTMTRHTPWHLAEPDGWRLAIDGEVRVDATRVATDALTDVEMHYETFAEPATWPSMATLLVSLTQPRYATSPPPFTALPLHALAAALDNAAMDAFRGVVDAAELDALVQRGGYTAMDADLMKPGETLWARVTQRCRYDPAIAHFHRLLAMSPCASIGETSFAYDSTGYLVATVTSPDGLATRTDWDYRALRPLRVTDANQTVTEAAYDAFGRTIATTLHGSEWAEDHTPLATGFAAMDTWSRPSIGIPGAIDNPVMAIGGLATVTIYDDHAWTSAVPAMRQPPHKLTLSSDRFPGRGDAAIHMEVVFTDGSGRSLMTSRRTADATWAIVERSGYHDIDVTTSAYRPYTSTTGRWTLEVPGDLASHQHYDAWGRMLGRVDAEGRESSVAYHAWYTTHRDENLHAQHSHRADAGMSTPRIAAYGSDGRVVRQVGYYRRLDSDAPERWMERHGWSAAGRGYIAFDARSVVRAEAVRTDSPALGGGDSWSADAGERWTFVADTGAAIWQRNARGDVEATTYDIAGRPLERHVTTVGDSRRLAERIRYGRAEDGVANLAGRAVSILDEAGRHTLDRVALTGHEQETSVTLIDADEPPDWSGNADDLLEPAVATTHRQFDVFGALLSMKDTGGHERRYAYGLDGRLRQSWITIAGGTERAILIDIDWDAQGRPLHQRTANGMQRTWEWGAADGRLLSSKASTQAGEVVRDLTITYDAAGNVLALDERAEVANVPVASRRIYAYDAFHQLIQAEGRESEDSVSGPYLPAPLPMDGTAQPRGYHRSYTYDANGNIVMVLHDQEGTPPERREEAMVVAPLSNRSLPASAGVPADAIDDAFDAQGCARTLTPLGQPLAWDHAARLRRVEDDKGTETHLYDRTGKRLRKRHVDTSGGIEVTRYFDGFEMLTRPGMPSRHTLTLPSVLGEAVVMHEPGGSADDLLRFSLRDHVTTSLMRVDDAGALVSYEEYHPFGNVAFECASADEASLQTRRYAAMPRDDTGLYDYGLRHYAPWHWRWISPDPGGDIDGLNAYRMARNNPIGLVDRHGLVPTRVAFDDKDIEGFEHIRQAMRAGLRDDGLFAQAALYVMVGRSPQMLGEYMRHMGETVVQLPLSGLTRGGKTTVKPPLDDKAKKRRDRYLYRSLQPALVSISKKYEGLKIPIVVVDYGVSGASIAKVHNLVSQHVRAWDDPRADAWKKSFKGMGSTYQQPIGATFDVRMAAISAEPTWQRNSFLIHEVALNGRNILRFRHQDRSDLHSALLNPLNLSLRGTHRFLKIANNAVDEGLAFTTSVYLDDIDSGKVTHPPYLADAHRRVTSMIEAARRPTSAVAGVPRKRTGLDATMDLPRSRWMPHLWFEANWLHSLNRWYYGPPGIPRYIAARNEQPRTYRWWRK